MGRENVMGGSEKKKMERELRERARKREYNRRERENVTGEKKRANMTASVDPRVFRAL